MIQALTRWWQRRTTRYSIWYVDSKGAVKLGSGETLKEAKRIKVGIDNTLRLMKACAPAGPQEAKHVILPDGIEPERATLAQAKGGE